MGRLAQTAGGKTKADVWQFFERTSQNTVTKQWRGRCKMPGCNFEGYVFPAQILEHHGFISENKNDKSKCVRLCKYSSPEAQKILGESFSATQKRVRDKIQHEQARIDADNASIITHYAEAGLSMEEIKRTPGLLRRADSTISSAQSAEADLAEDEPVEDEPAEATSSSINAMTKNYRNAIQTELDELWTMALVSGGIQGHFLANPHFQKAVARTAAVVFFFHLVRCRRPDWGLLLITQRWLVMTAPATGTSHRLQVTPPSPVPHDTAGQSRFEDPAGEERQE